jgi:hypothetical protein
LFGEGGIAARRIVTAEDLRLGAKAKRKPESMVTYTFFTCATPVDVRVEGIFAPLEPPHW